MNHESTCTNCGSTHEIKTFPIINWADGTLNVHLCVPCSRLFPFEPSLLMNAFPSHTKNYPGDTWIVAFITQILSQSFVPRYQTQNSLASLFNNIGIVNPAGRPWNRFDINSLWARTGLLPIRTLQDQAVAPMDGPAKLEEAANYFGAHQLPPPVEEAEQIYDNVTGDLQALRQRMLEDDDQQ